MIKPKWVAGDRKKSYYYAVFNNTRYGVVYEVLRNDKIKWLVRGTEEPQQTFDSRSEAMQYVVKSYNIKNTHNK